MIKLYDKDMTYMESFCSYKELKITEELETGYKTAQFQLPYSFGYLREEQKVEIEDYLYVIKEVNMEDVADYDVYCKPYFGKLATKVIDNYAGFGVTFPQIMNDLLAETGWTWDGTIYGSFTIDMHNKTLLEALADVSDIYDCFLKYDTKNRKIAASPKESQTEPKTSYVLTPAALTYCQVQSNTYDLVTRLYPIGKDLVTIQNVNGNCLYLENHQYTDENIVGYYINGHISNPDDLMNIAQRKLDELSKPVAAYKIQLSQFNSPLVIGDRVRVIDTIKGVDITAYVKKIVEFPHEQEESYVELGETLVSFDNIYKDLQNSQNEVNKDTLRNLTELNKKIY